MGERESCEDCSKWEKKKCSTHFQKMRFCVTLVGHFADGLAIPKKFAYHWKEKLPEAVTLKGPNGVAWIVGLVSNGDNLLFKNGWKEFVNNNSLEENDILVFKYYGDSRFNVVMFDQRSSCEKETLYFIRKCGHIKLNVECQMIEKARDSSVEAIHPTTDDGVGSGHIKLDVGCQMTQDARQGSVEAIHATTDDGVGSGPKNLDIGYQTGENSWDGFQEAIEVALDDGIQRPSSKKRRIEEYVTPMPFVRHSYARDNRKIRKVAHSIKSVTPKRTIRKKDPSTSVEENDIYDTEKNSIRSGKKDAQYVSNRIPITESQKQKALELAQAALTNHDSFIVIMQPSHVYKRFYVSIPAEWANIHLSPKSQVVTLRFKETTWSVNLNYRKPLCTRGFAGGWKKFAIENNLEEFDVCRFELDSPPGTSVVMNVSIFRVVEELRSATRVI